jgi:hypothetical protein
VITGPGLVVMVGDNDAGGVAVAVAITWTLVLLSRARTAAMVSHRWRGTPCSANSSDDGVPAPVLKSGVGCLAASIPVVRNRLLPDREEVRDGF